MKTTTLRREFDKTDVFEDVDVKFKSTYTGIDMEKVKKMVYMETKAKAKTFKFNKKVLFSLIAAVIIIAALGSTAIYAYGGLGTFLNFFRGESDSAPVTLPQKVEIMQGSDLYNISVTGLTGDSMKTYMAVNLTKKDGTPFTDDNYTLANLSYNMDSNVYDCRLTIKDKDGAEISGMSPWVYYELSSDRKSMDVMFTLLTRGKNLSGCTAYIESDAFNSTNILQEISTYDTPEQYLADSENREDIYNSYYDKHPEFDFETGGGLTYTRSGVIHTAIVQTKKFELPFAVSFDLNFSSDGQITQELTAAQLPDYIMCQAEYIQMTLTSFGINLSAKCTSNALKAAPDGKIFGFPDDNTSKVILDDGTQYYLYVTEGHYENTEGDFCYQGDVLNFSSLPGHPIYPELILIDVNKIQEVLINGVTVYSK